MNRSLDGDGQSLKAYTIGVSALGVNAERSCPETTARMQASRVRRLLSKYYQVEGNADSIELQLPTGIYEPRFYYRTVSSSSESRPPRVVITEFENLSGSPVDTQFARGLGEALVGLFIHFPQLQVLGHLSGAPPSGDNYVLTGSVARAGSSLRVSCHLQAPDGQLTVWADRFDHAVTDQNFLNVQDAIAQQVACRIGDPASGAVARNESSRASPHVDAPTLAVARFYQLLASPSALLLVGAKAGLEKILPHSKGGAVPHAAYSFVLGLSYLTDPSGAKNDLLSAEAHARAAIDRDSRCALAHLAKGLVHFLHHEEACARRELLRCRELDPMGAIHPACCGMLLALMGEWEEGLNWIASARQRAATLPSYFHVPSCLYEFFEAGNPEKALSFARQVELADGAWGELLSAACLSRLGRLAEARRAASRVAVSIPAIARKPDKILRQWLFIPELAESLAAAVMDAGLGSPARKPRARPEYKVAISRRELPSEIRIGILQSLSGTMALSEAQLVNAAMLAVEEINQQGGVMGRPLRAIVEDGASDPLRFAERARKLVNNDGVSSIFGCWTSSSRKAVLPIVEQVDAILWYPMQYEGLEKSRHIVYTGSCLNQQIEPAIRWALKQKRNRAYTVGSDYVFPRTANRLIRALVEAGGGTVLGEAYEPLGNARFSEIAEEIAALQPDIVYNTVNGSDNVAFFEALADAGIKARDIPVMSFSVSELELSRCGATAQGHLACWSYFQSMDNPENHDLVRRFRGRYGESEVLSDPVVTAYSQVHLWKDVVERAGSLETDAVLAHLSGSRMDLGGEVLEVVENNHVWRRAVIGEVRGSQFDIVWRSSQPIAPLPWLGVDKTDFMSRDLILGALQALPEMAERTSNAGYSRPPERKVGNAP